jgi:PEGA domain
MQFMSPDQKRRHARNLYIGYVLVGVLTLLATYILIASARGYDLLSSKGDVVQNGLLFVDSRPSGADIYVNGNKESNSTNAKLSLPDNNYQIALKKQGYRDWSSSVNLFGGTVEFLTYPRLLPIVPTVLKTEPITSTALPTMLQSRDKQHLAFIDLATPNQVKIYDLNSSSAGFSSIAISEDIVGSKPIKSIELVEWAGDNQHILGKVTSPEGQYSYVVMSADNSPAVNISQMFNLSGQEKLGFWDGKWDRLYVFTPGAGVVLANLKDKSLAAQSLVSDPVSEIFPFGVDRFAYVTIVGQETQLKLYADSKIYTALAIPDSKQLLSVKNFGYNRNDYMAVAGGGLDKSYVFKNFVDSVKKSSTGRAPAYLLDPVAAKSVEVSRGGRFVMFTDGDKVSTYDIEQKLLSNFSVAASKPTQIGWYDDTRLYELGTDNKLQILDFNGANIYDLATNVVATPYQNADVSQSSFITKSDTAVLSLTTLDIKNPSK